MFGDPANPATTWPPASSNYFMVDNLSYYILPKMDIAISNQFAVISWPTNTADFILQQNTEADSASGWAPVTNAPAVIGNRMQVAVPVTAGHNLYRLKGPEL
jgi:hypothetical protein